MKPILARFPLLALGVISMALGVWGGLARLAWGVPIPASNANWISFHGPLMVCGFLGTLISLERAVALRRTWAYLAPALCGAGAVAIAAGALGKPGPALLTAGSAGLLAIYGAVLLRQRALFIAVMAAGAVLWTIGNALWLSGSELPRAVPWWAGFLVLTIAGERLEFMRFQPPSRFSTASFLAASAVLVVGVVWGERLLGAGMVLISAWLFRCDIARRTIRQPGLPRYAAVCLLSGYVWLAVAGTLFALHAPVEPGLLRDASLHALFVGFVFAMIFGHAPIIFPAVLGIEIPFRKVFYVPLALLHASLILRVAGDLLPWSGGRMWGGLLNAVSIGLFFVSIAGAAVLRARSGSAAGPAGSGTRPQGS